MRKWWRRIIILPAVLGLAAVALVPLLPSKVSATPLDDSINYICGQYATTGYNDQGSKDDCINTLKASPSKSNVCKYVQSGTMDPNKSDGDCARAYDEGSKASNQTAASQAVAALGLTGMGLVPITYTSVGEFAYLAAHTDADNPPVVNAPDLSSYSQKAQDYCNGKYPDMGNFTKDCAKGYDNPDVNGICTNSGTMAECLDGQRVAKDSPEYAAAQQAKTDECRAQGKVWDGNAKVCNDAPPCSEGALGSCKDEGSCTGAGGSWDADSSTCTTTDQENTCQQKSGFIAWITCPLLVKISDGLQEFFQEILNNLFAYNGITNDQLRDAWSKMVPIANIAFAIVFLIIIYSTATGNGFGAISNYDIKKILPRLIIAAILVNVSFYICAAIVDLTNIVGANIGRFIGYSNGAPILDISDDFITSFIMVIVIIVAWSSIALGLLVILAVLAFRNALITILIVISPVAFVLWLLPNTEQWFKKWLNEFTRMLFVYPAISAVFGAAMLASSILKTTNNGLEWLITPMLVLAPMIAIIPIMKMGGQIMGKATGAIQGGVDKMGGSKLRDLNRNTNKAMGGALQERTRNWRGPIGSLSRSGTYWKMRQEHKDQRDQAFENSQRTGRYRGLQGQINQAGFQNQAAQSGVNAMKAQQYNAGGNAQLRLQINQNELQEEVAKATTEGLKQAYRTGGGRNLNNELLARGQGANAYRSLQASHYAQDIQAGGRAGFLAQTAGAGTGTYVTRALANAQNIVQKEDREAIDAIKATSNINPGDNNGLAREFQAAVGANDHVAARAYAEMLGSAGSPGAQRLGDEITNMEQAGGNGGVGSDLNQRLRSTVLGMGLKQKDAFLDRWAVSGQQTDANGNVTQPASSLSDIEQDTSIISSLSDAEIASQATGRAASGIERARASGDIDDARSVRIRDNESLATVLTNRSRDALG